MVVTLGVLLASDQRGLLAVAVADAPTEGGPVIEATAGSTAPLRRESSAGGFDALAVRLRVGARLAVLGESVAIAPPPPGAFAGQAPPPPPRQLAPSRYDSSTATSGTWALIIGVNDYPGAQYDLRSAVNDANEMNEALAKLGVSSGRRMVLRDGQATAATIRAALDWLTAHAGPGSTIVLFFAGHVQRVERGHVAIVGSDGGLVPDTEVAALLDRSPAERAWIAIAACYGGGFDEVVRPGRILTAAAPADRVAYENEGFGRSYLVEYMVRRAILGKAISTVEGAFSWAVAELQRDYPDRLPVQQDALDGDFELRLDPPPPSDPPPSDPPPSDPPAPSEDACSSLTIGVVRCS